jgi:DNA (cytosine-5)-methyltransferase 1
MEDARGTLFYEIARIVAAKKPKFLLLENVKHIMKIQKGFVFETILKTFAELGYTMKTVVLSPHQFGIPQNRERVYFMGVRDGTLGDIPTPVKSKHVILGKRDAKYKVKQEVEDAFNAWNETFHILKQAITKVPVLLDEFKNSDDLTTYSAWTRKYVEENKKIYAIDPVFWDAWMTKHADVLAKRKVYRKLEWQVGSYADDESIWDHFIQLRQSGMRVKKATTFPTLVAIVQTPIYGPEHRFLTPRECARLQSFPETHTLHEKDQVAYKQLGNSVNVIVVHHVASYLLAQAS